MATARSGGRWPDAVVTPGRPRPASVGVRVAYALVAASSLWLLIRQGNVPVTAVAATDVNLLICAAVLLSLATAAVIRLWNVPAVRILCILTAAWLTASAIVFPDPAPAGGILGRLAIALVAVWADEAMQLNPEPLPHAN